MAAPRTEPPPLESGDHLLRDEFHRCYLEHPEIKRAELVAGDAAVLAELDPGERRT